MGDETPYHADAVHFDGNAWLSINSLVSQDVGTFSFSGWFKRDTLSTAPIFAQDPDGNYNCSLGSPNANVGNLSVNFNVADFSQTFDASYANGTLVAASWQHILFSLNTNLDSGLKEIALYVNDVLKSPTLTDGEAAFTNDFSGVPFFCFGDTAGIVGDVADVWISQQSLLTAGAIAEADRRKFISAGGKPVDPAGFPSGLILFSGNAAAFATNQGTGGAFTLTGSLTDASTSPSD